MNTNFPRRIVHPFPPGSLLKRVSTQPPVRREVVAGRDLGYLAAIRTLPCLRCGMEPSEAAHVRFASAAFGKASGMARKPEDRHSVPLCSGCHRLDRDAQHNRGEREFWDSIGINPLIVAERLYAQRDDLVRPAVHPSFREVLAKFNADFQGRPLDEKPRPRWLGRGSHSRKTRLAGSGARSDCGARW